MKMVLVSEQDYTRPLGHGSARRVTLSLLLDAWRGTTFDPRSLCCWDFEAVSWSFISDDHTRIVVNRLSVCRLPVVRVPVCRLSVSCLSVRRTSINRLPAEAFERDVHFELRG
jgi:hypothetical protein